MPTITPDRISPPHQNQAELKQALKDINYAFRTGLFVSGVNFFVGFLLLAQPELSEKAGTNALCLLDGIIILGLSMGVNSRNQTAAKFLFGYYLVGKLLSLAFISSNIAGIPMGILILHYFYRGIIGTDAYHRISRDIARNEVNYAYANNFAVEAEPVTTPSPAETHPAAEPAAPRNDRFWVADELIELCDHDRSQAEWLLQEVRRKNPTKSMGTCNEIAIEQIKLKQRPHR
jgi:hypothetical protein